MRTTEMTDSESLALTVEDFTGVSRRAAGIPRQATVGDMLTTLGRKLGLPDQDATGRPVMYGAITADGQMLNPSDRVGDVLRPDDRVVMTRTLTAG